jgi:uncharacterized protein (TIGR00730 family)
MASDSGDDDVRVDDAALDVIEDALVKLWGVANDLSRIHAAEPRFYRVTIFGSARVREGDPVYEGVKRVAAELARRGVDIVTGGGPGVMQAANEGENLGDPDNRTRSIGVGVELPFEQGANPFVERLYTHRTFFTRLHQFVRLSNAFVIVGGGIGTALETMMIWQLLQVRQIGDLPLVFVGPQWRDLVDWARRHMVDGGARYASPEDMDIPLCVDDIDDVVALLDPHVRAFQARHGRP